MSTTDDRSNERGGIVAFRAPAKLVADAEAAAVAEGVSRSDIARRALMRDLATKAGESR
jgi:hypothetical protein